MKSATTILIGAWLCIGCGAKQYGYAPAAWNDLTPAERDAVALEAREHVRELLEELRQREFENQPINVWLGSRSNTY